jgi:flavin reductase (DIM6/NTAB) family NADH-FMN oxidoreductase RutF
MTSIAPAMPAAAPEPPFDPRDFRRTLGSFGTGVTIVTAQTADGRRAGLTCNSFASVSLNPPLVLWSLVIHSPSLRIFQEATHFAVNVLARNQADLAMTFAKSGTDKFSSAVWWAGCGDAPVLDGVAASFECRNSYRYYGGDHIIFMGEVEHYTRRDDAEPLLFVRGQFGAFEAGS